jgi:hypothetical protein
MVCEHEYMNISPPPPIIELATALIIILKTWSEIVSDQPMFWSDMIGHLIFLNGDT